MHSRAHYLQRMGIQTYQLRSATAEQEIDPQAGAAAVDEMAPDRAAVEPQRFRKAPIDAAQLVESSTASAGTGNRAEPAAEPGGGVASAEAEAAAATATESQQRETACDYLCSSSGRVVLFALSDDAFDPSQIKLFSAISGVLCGSNAKFQQSRWQPLKGSTPGSRARTFKTLLADLVDPDAGPPDLILLGAGTASLWTNQDWDLLVGSTATAEAPFSALRFGPGLPEMLQSPYLKAQLWQLIRDLTTG